MSKNYYDNEYGDNNSEQDQSQQKFHVERKNIPVKPHMAKLEELKGQLLSEVREGQKNANVLRSNFSTLDNRMKERCNELTKLITEDIHNFSKEFENTKQSDKSQTDFLKQQLHGLNQDKTKLQQSSIGLDTRLKQCEGDIGMNDY